MATPDAGGPSRQPRVSSDTDSDSRSTDSDSASHIRDFGQRPGTICRWRTARYHDRECSRYFDCPSHVVERALSDTEQESEGEQEEEHRGQGGMESEDTQGHSDPGTVSPLSEASDDGDGHRASRSPSPEGPAAAAQGTNTTSGIRRVSEAGGPQQESGGASSSSPGLSAGNLPSEVRPQPELERRETSGSGTGNDHSNVSTRQAPGLMRRDGGAVFRPQAANVPVASPAPATRLLARPSPTLSSPTEVMLPRWQPDSEVTYCPICGTQFSIFVRKHHCR